MNGYREDGYNNSSSCYFHPKEAVIGVCPLCLNERLLVLAAKQGHHPLSPSSKPTHHRKTTSSHQEFAYTRKPQLLHLPKIFDLGSFLINRLEFRHWKSDVSHDLHLHHHHDNGDGGGDDASSSQEDSFISIKFENNGIASWEKGTINPKASLEDCSNNKSWSHDLNNIKEEAKDKDKDKDKGTTKETMTVIEHGKPRGTLRWRKRIGHLFQLNRWKRSNKGNVCHVGTKVEGVKVRKGWIRTLTKRRTKE